MTNEIGNVSRRVTGKRKSIHRKGVRITRFQLDRENHRASVNSNQTFVSVPPGN